MFGDGAHLHMNTPLFITIKDTLFNASSIVSIRVIPPEVPGLGGEIAVETKLREHYFSYDKPGAAQTALDGVIAKLKALGHDLPAF